MSNYKIIVGKKSGNICLPWMVKHFKLPYIIERDDSIENSKLVDNILEIVDTRLIINYLNDKYLSEEGSFGKKGSKVILQLYYVDLFLDCIETKKSHLNVLPEPEAVKDGFLFSEELGVLDMVFAELIFKRSLSQPWVITYWNRLMQNTVLSQIVYANF